jgi:archaeal flagellin FlaB
MMLKRLVKCLRRDERGITGLETAIILIAFVVVASVFAYTVLSAGIFSSQKGQEAIFAGLAETRATLEVKGSIFAYGNTTTGDVTAVTVTLTNTMGGQAIDLTPNADGNSTHATVISYTDSNQHISDLPWTVSWIGKNNGDNSLDQNEQAVIRVNLSDLNSSPATYTTFTIEIKPIVGASLILNRTLPAKIDAVMDLH